MRNESCIPVRMLLPLPTSTTLHRLARGFLILSMAGIGGCASLAGDDPIGSGGQAQSDENEIVEHAEAPAVESRTGEIPTYNSQASALTIADLCRVMSDGGADLGPAKVSCSIGPRDVVTFAASKGDLAASILANASDKLALEYEGDGESHEYKNNLGESLRVKFDFVAHGTHQTTDGTMVDGSFRADIFIENAEGYFRFGYYFNEKLP